MAPTIQDGLVLMKVFIKHSTLPRQAIVDVAITDDTVDSSPTAWCNAFMDTFAVALAVHLDTNASITGIKAIKGDGTDTFFVGESTRAPIAGGRDISSLPPNCAVLVKKVTGLGGRRNRGRWFLPWYVAEDAVGETGNLTGAMVTEIQSDIDDVYSMWDGRTIGYTPVIENRIFDLPWDNPARELIAIEGSAPVEALVVESIVATQRRRMPRS